MYTRAKSSWGVIELSFQLLCHQWSKWYFNNFHVLLFFLIPRGVFEHSRWGRIYLRLDYSYYVNEYWSSNFELVIRTKILSSTFVQMDGWLRGWVEGRWSKVYFNSVNFKICYIIFVNLRSRVLKRSKTFVWESWRWGSTIFEITLGSYVF